MRFLGTLAAVPFVFSVYVAGEHGYLCSDSEGNTNTTYDQALVEGSVKDTCLPDSELSAAELAANVGAKKYPRVWVDSENYGFNETVLLWKYQGNSSESLEEADVLVFTNKSCDILGLLQTSGDQYTICKGVNEQNNKKTSSEILSKKPRPGIFSEGSPNSSNSGGTREKLKNSPSITGTVGTMFGAKSSGSGGSERGFQGDSSGEQKSMPGPPRPDPKLSYPEKQHRDQETLDKYHAARGRKHEWIMGIDGHPYFIN
ncbi:BgtE-5692 [Blumeria graminis f. sp. tritici]|uniref:BgtE-5692 n=2 Tax=Blumeria graminis f. sp. tritici TaxID=62690 RepID=A0A381L922_BLUGR|nr:putative secreted effector protein [Blumeria graminis f. sp. tritici 96224]VDB85930.1 BgtE-5692 [Blumeria graminis f. sp. tritici]